MDAIRALYELSDIMGDDLYKVAFAIRAYHPVETVIDIIISDIENLKLTEYQDTISMILDLNTEQVLQAGQGTIFNNEKSYIAYLQKTMDEAGIVYAPFVRKSLFD